MDYDDKKKTKILVPRQKRKIIKYLRDDDEYTESFELEIRKIIEYK